MGPEGETKIANDGNFSNLNFGWMLKTMGREITRKLMSVIFARLGLKCYFGSVGPPEGRNQREIGAGRGNVTEGLGNPTGSACGGGSLVCYLYTYFADMSICIFYPF